MSQFFCPWETCFSCLINGSLFQDIIPGEVHLSRHSQLQKLFNCSILNDLIILKFLVSIDLPRRPLIKLKDKNCLFMTSKSFC